MGTSIAYTPDQVTKALMALVTVGGNAAAVAREILDEDSEAPYQVPESTLRQWKNDTHAERYRQLEDQYGRELELQLVQLARQNAQRAAEIEADLLEDMAKVPPEMRAQALKAVADSKAKNVDKVLALTGRPRERRDDTGDFAAMLKGMAERGYLKINVELDAPLEGTARERS